MPIQTTTLHLPHGAYLSVRACGRVDDPVLVFLHGFPEGAFIWDDFLQHFAAQGFYCVAPNLRGFEASYSPLDAAQYKAKYLVQDVVALIEQVAAKHSGKVAALVAHDWGGAVAWGAAQQRPDVMQRLMILNSPHPLTFLRELQHSPAQIAASGYMNFLARPDAPQLLAERDYERLFGFFGKTAQGGISNTWLTDAVKAQYRTVWAHGLHGGCNYYAASPLRPDTAKDLTLPVEMGHITVPTHILWGLQDAALRPELLDGLEHYIPDLHITRLPLASHWVSHEAPDTVKAELAAFLKRTV